MRTDPRRRAAPSRQREVAIRQDQPNASNAQAAKLLSIAPPQSLTGKALRFGIVGVFNTVVDVAAFALLLAAGATALAANVGAWLVAVSFSYAINSRWSFERSGELHEARSIARFLGMGALISLGVSSAAILALAPLTGLWPAKLIGIVAAAVLNFFAARWSIENRLR